jgi:hypothetical protein
VPHAILYSRYVAQSSNLGGNAGSNAFANEELGQRVWEVPDQNFSPGPSWSGNPLDIGHEPHEGVIAEIANAFDRIEIEEAYPFFLLPPFGSMGDTASAKLQSDLLGAQERAYRLRAQTPIRCGIHAAVRRAGQGSSNFGRIDNYLQDLITAGTTKFRPQ